MIRVQRGNVVLEVEDDAKSFYKDRGYAIIDQKGNVIEKAIPKDAASLRKLYLETQAELNKYKTLVHEAKRELEKLKKKQKKAQEEKK